MSLLVDEDVAREAIAVAYRNGHQAAILNGLGYEGITDSQAIDLALTKMRRNRSDVEPPKGSGIDVCSDQHNASLPTSR
jgi:hypothetical protein